MNEIFQATGGARAGWSNATWPLAKLTATPDALRIAVFILGDYRFTPETVVAITRYTLIPVFGWGIKIEHCVAEYPAYFVFWHLGNPDRILRGISDAGFLPKAPASAIPARNGWAMRWQALLVAAIFWNGLSALDVFWSDQPQSFPGPFTLLADGLLFAAVIATIRVPAFQRLMLKPGRSIKELQPILNLVLFVSGFIFVIFLFVLLLQPSGGLGPAR